MAAGTTTKAPATEKAEKPKAPLTLQQKFVELRKAVPAITQKQHSDGVKYKFAKIFDVYELLTPAMNEHGVNFDIIAEKATRHAENGDPVYYSSFTQHTRSGDRLVWVYEADMTIVNTTIAVTTKLAATEAIDTQMVMGLNLRTGELEIAEYDGQIRGQMNLTDYAEADEDDEEPEDEEVPTGQPLDLKRRNRQQPAPELIPGRDYDPDTGEVHETAGQSADDQKATGSSIVTMFNKAAQA